MSQPPQYDGQQPDGQRPEPASEDAPQTPQYGPPQAEQYGSQHYGAPQYGSQPYGSPQPPYGGGYGAPQAPPPGYGQQPMHQGTNTMSVVGLVTAFLIWPVGLVLSIIGLSQTKRTGESGRGLAIAGIIVSVLAGLASILVVVFAVGMIGEAINEVEQERSLAERAIENDGFAVPPSEDPIERLQGLEDEFDGLGLDDLDEDIRELEEALGNLGYASGADAETCDAIWGADEDAVMNLFIDAALITEPDEALEFAETTSARVNEVAAGAPDEVRADLEALGEVVARSVTVEALSEAEAIQTETERAVTAIGEYCFGG